MIFGVGALTVVAAAGAAALTVGIARFAVTPPSNRIERVRILGHDPVRGTVTLNSSLDSRLPGRYGLWFSRDSGHARMGGVVSQTPDTVTRELLGVDFGDIGTAERGRFGGWFHLAPGDLGYPFDSIGIETPLGGAPAWHIPAEGDSTSWVIQVHGRGVRKAEALRAVPVFRSAGYHSLLISWRNDGEAPRSEDGLYGLGSTEWLDVHAALEHVAERGATEVVLMGWSMGGATVLQTAANSSLAGLVSGIVLESPVVDWTPTLIFQAAQRRVPARMGRAVIALIGSRRGYRITGQLAPIDFRTLDFVLRRDELVVPILLMHSDDDGFVPSEASAALAVARPDIVTYRRWSVARHAKLWNYDPERFDREITEWLADLARRRARSAT